MRKLLLILGALVCFSAPVAAAEWRRNPPMDAATAKATLSRGLWLYKKDCPGKPYQYTCTNHVAMILYGSLTLGKIEIFQRYVDEYRAAPSVAHENNGCTGYLFNDDRRKAAYRIDRYAALVYIQDKLNIKANSYYASQGFLCTLWDSYNNSPSMIWRPPVPGYPSTSDAVIDVMERRIGDRAAKTAKKFAEEIATPYFATLVQMSKDEQRRKSGKLTSAYYALVLELSKNAASETRRQKFPDDYQEFMNGVVDDARYMVEISSKNENIHP